ncbi:MAG TPA: hypothetical protein DCZ41_04555 [Firmicutes bacterium]|nr:hypothetical protein [Bacillota bacterium]
MKKGKSVLDIKKNPIRAGGGLLFLANISLAGVGFSTWMVGSDNASLDLNPQIASVIDIGEYITFKGNSRGFDYCEEGPIEDGMISSVVTLSIPFQIDCGSSPIADHINENRGFKLLLTLIDRNEFNVFDSSVCEFSNFFLFLDKGKDFGITRFQADSSLNVKAEKSWISSNKYYEAEFDLSELGITSLNSINFCVEYTIDFFSVDSFVKNVVPSLKSEHNAALFSFKVEVIE